MSKWCWYDESRFAESEPVYGPFASKEAAIEDGKLNTQHLEFEVAPVQDIDLPGAAACLVATDLCEQMEQMVTDQQGLSIPFTPGLFSLKNDAAAQRDLDRLLRDWARRHIQVDGIAADIIHSEIVRLTDEELDARE